MDSIPYSIRLKPEHLSKIKELEINLGEVVRDYLDSYFLNEEEIKITIEKHKFEVKKLQKWLKNRPKISGSFIKEEQKLGKNEVIFLKETKKLLKNRPEFLEGRLSLFCNTFGYLTKKPTKKEFLKLLDRV